MLEKAALNFNTVYEENARKILNICLKMTGDEQSARDISQDVWVKVYQNLSNFEGKSALSTWIYKIAFNHIMNHFKREKRSRRRELLNLDIRDALEDGKNITEFLPDPGMKSPVDNLQAKEREKIVWKMILRLPEKQRLPLILFRYEGMSYQQIAEVLDISVNAVESRLHRALQKLRNFLEPYLNKI